MLECPRCGGDLRNWNDTHECGPRDDSHVRYNLATSCEEQAMLSETVRLVYGIDEEFWYRSRPHDRAVILRKRADAALIPKD